MYVCMWIFCGGDTQWKSWVEAGGGGGGGEALGYFLGVYVPPGTPNWYPV